MANNVLVIAGMHRSGTSLITHWLHDCGLQVGERLVGAGTGNVEGHFEDEDFFLLHQQILIDNGVHPDGLHPPEAMAPSAQQQHKMVYNRMIVRTLDKLPQDRYLVVSYKSMQSDCARVHAFLSSHWSFQLRYKKFASVFRSELITHQADVAPLAVAPCLLAEAAEVTASLRDYLPPQPAAPRGTRALRRYSLAGGDSPRRRLIRRLHLLLPTWCRSYCSCSPC